MFVTEMQIQVFHLFNKLIFKKMVGEMVEVVLVDGESDLKNVDFVKKIKMPMIWMQNANVVTLFQCFVFVEPIYVWENWWGYPPKFYFFRT